MGMFDYLTCKHPLPGEPPAFAGVEGHQFQTKDLDCSMAAYEITAEGRLMLVGCGFLGVDLPDPVDQEHHGDVAFYDSNVRGGAGGHQFTDDGEDAESVDYLARFDRGQLVEILETARERHPALPIAIMDCGYTRPTDEEIAADEARRAESLTGREMFVLWGGTEAADGYLAPVVAEGPREWVLRKPDGRMEVIDRGLRDHILFDSREAAEASREEDRLEREARRQEFDEAMAARVKGA